MGDYFLIVLLSKVKSAVFTLYLEKGHDYLAYICILRLEMY